MTPRRGKKKVKPSEPTAILERNLERYPWAVLHDKGDQLRLELLLDAAGPEGRAWMVVAEDGSNLPGPFSADLYVTLCQLFNAAGRPDSRSVSVTFRDLAELMKRPVSGSIYTAINSALHQLVQVSIRAVNTFREGSAVASLRTFHVLEAAETIYLRGGAEEGTGNMQARVRFSKEVADSIASGNFRLLDTGAYYALPTPTARRLYRYLDYRRWRGPERLDTLTIPLRQLAQELPIDREAPSHIKRTLDPAHALLIEQRVLESAEYEERAVAGKKRPVISVIYRFADIASEMLDARREPSADPHYTEDMVTEILELLGDKHSTAFYTKVVRALPEPVLRGVIGSIREMIRGGMKQPTARKMFTTTARNRAAAIGVEL